MRTWNVAIDGPAGAGKSSVAREVASELGCIYVDTGALYRAVALYAQQFSKQEKFLKHLDDCDISLKYLGGVQRVFLNGEDVTDDLRTPEISMAASNISTLKKVREFLLDLQRDIAHENNVIMDGRDIGTVVLPDADVKIYLTASAEERASRRYLELEDKPDAPKYEEILEEIKRRDDQDMHRKHSPLRQAEDAIVIDTTTMGFYEVCEEVEKQIRKTLDLD